MSRRVVIPGSRDVRGTLDTPGPGSDDWDGEAGGTPDASACVVACPPHPEMGGSRSDRRLRAVSDALVAGGSGGGDGDRDRDRDRDGGGIACLRIDYGPFDEGYGECRDARNAVSWAADRYDRVGLFGYSFGGSIALLAAADLVDLAAVSALAPAPRLASDLDAVGALDAIACPVQVVYGERDDTVDWRPVVDRARALGHAVEGVAGGHHFVGQGDRVGRLVAGFLADRL